jgi:desulfoferrodoxin-like iron-binding protein
VGVEQVGDIYRCSICSNEVKVTKVGGGILVCCGEEMEKIQEQAQTGVNLPDAGG